MPLEGWSVPLEPMTGIGPAFQEWESCVLPLHYIDRLPRNREFNPGAEIFHMNRTTQWAYALERVMVVETTSSVWRTDALTVVLHPHIKWGGG